MSKAAIGKALDSSNLDHVRNYLQRVHKVHIVAKGKRKRPSKQQLKDSIYGMKNVSAVLVDLQRMKKLKPSKKSKKDAKEDDDDDDDDEEEAEEDEDEAMLVGDDDDEEDDVMDMLKAELALRGKTTNGNSYPLLVRRLIYALRNEE
tara:strand:+ start:224 stop:664 length:441 start_codon:yes stop_codon:yes gene_type:complete